MLRRVIKRRRLPFFHPFPKRYTERLECGHKLTVGHYVEPVAQRWCDICARLLCPTVADTVTHRERATDPGALAPIETRRTDEADKDARRAFDAYERAREQAQSRKAKKPGIVRRKPMLARGWVVSRIEHISDGERGEFELHLIGPQDRTVTERGVSMPGALAKALCKARELNEDK